jgi:hypothetical protein
VEARLTKEGKVEMRNNNAGCLSALLPAFARIMLLMEWISRPVQ